MEAQLERLGLWDRAERRPWARVHRGQVCCQIGAPFPPRPIGTRLATG